MHPNMETMEGVGFEKDGAVEDNACIEEQCSFYGQEQCSFNIYIYIYMYIYIIYIHYPIIPNACMHLPSIVKAAIGGPRQTRHRTTTRVALVVAIM